jgi:hypothetical protein
MLDTPLPAVIEGVAGARAALAKLWRIELSMRGVGRLLDRRRDPLRPAGAIRSSPLRWTRADFVKWAIRNGPGWKRRREAQPGRLERVKMACPG